MTKQQSIKIAVVGPPHSGKSVFLGGLTKNLPRHSYFLFRAVPDGEGSWTYRNDEARKYRRPGTFTQEIVDWYVQSLTSCTLADIVLVDLGGKITKENQRILVEGDVQYGIILSRDPEATAEWRSFLAECGVVVVAEVFSDYHAVADTVDGPKLAVHHLERGESCEDRPAIQAVACKVLDLAPTSCKGGIEMKMERLINAGIMEIQNLAESLGKETIERELPNGRIVQQLCWEGADLAKIASLFHNHSGKFPEVVRINGAAPAWLVSALVHEFHPRAAALNSPDGYVPVGCHNPEGEGYGNNLSFTVDSREDGWVVVTAQAIDPSVPFAPTDLDSLVPPKVEMGAKIILSGRIPNWMMSSLAMSYHGTAKAVACFQPGTGSTVAWTHSQEVGLGEVIPE